MEFSLALDYPPNHSNVPRYERAHAALDARIRAGRDAYADALAIIQGYAESLRLINVQDLDPAQPSWVNGFLPGLDSAAIYGFVRSRKPAHYFEIGSGNSTKFAARAIADAGLTTTITSIDPHPRVEVNALCDEIVRAPLEAADLGVFSTAQAGDIVFMDGSHRVFMNGDVVTFFLDLLPALPAGVLVGIHDIYLPFDYPLELADRYYSEQYMLAVWLLSGNAEIVLPAHWASVHLRDALSDLWRSDPRFSEIEHHGCAFWLLTG